MKVLNKNIINKFSFFLLLLNLIFFITTSNYYANINLAKPPEGHQNSLAPMLKKVIPSVVNIKVFNKQKYLQLLKEQSNNPHKMPLSPEHGMIGMGSGVIINAKDGVIATNNHVIKHAEKILVTLHDGRNASATLIGTDPDSDLAIIKVTVDGLTDLKFADSEKAETGDFVVAIGSPFGLNQTVTSGIISGKGRVIGLEGFEDFIQTDASINPGNSGGALINLKGELIGINTAILAPDGGSVGIGFAIPSNMSSTIIQQLLRFGKVRRGLLGVIGQTLTPEIASAFDIPNQKGALIANITRDSVAYNSELKIGDVVYELNGAKINNILDLRNAVGLTPINENMNFKVIREGKSRNFKVKLLDPNEIKTRAQKIYPSLAGAYMDPVININIPHLGPVNGLKVLDILFDSPAWQQGLRNDDIILSVNNKKINDLDDLEKIIKSKGKDKPLLLQIARNDARENTSRFLALKPSA